MKSGVLLLDRSRETEPGVIPVKPDEYILIVSCAREEIPTSELQDKSLKEIQDRVVKAIVAKVTEDIILGLSQSLPITIPCYFGSAEDPLSKSMNFKFNTSVVIHSLDTELRIQLEQAVSSFIDTINKAR